MNPLKTIAFQTARGYSANGQVIVATLYDDHTVTFRDHARLITGSFKLPAEQDFEPFNVLKIYDASAYENDSLSWQDGMAALADGLPRNGLTDADFLRVAKAPRMAEIVMSQEASIDLNPDTLAGKPVEELAAKYAVFCHRSGDDAGVPVGALIVAKAQNLALLSAFAKPDSEAVRDLRLDLLFLARLAVEVECRAMDAMDTDQLTTAYEKFCAERNVPLIDARERILQVENEPDSEAKTLELVWMRSFTTNWDRAEDAIFAARFIVRGDGETDLFEADHLIECRAWVSGYTCRGDWGGYAVISIWDRELDRDRDVMEAPEPQTADSAFYNEDTFGDGTPDGMADDVLGLDNPDVTAALAS